jgi:hypothetical protein
MLNELNIKSNARFHFGIITPTGLATLSGFLAGRIVEITSGIKKCLPKHPFGGVLMFRC